MNCNYETSICQLFKYTKRGYIQPYVFIKEYYKYNYNTLYRWF